MDVKLAVLADAANISQEGNLNILGIFEMNSAAVSQSDLLDLTQPSSVMALASSRSGDCHVTVQITTDWPTDDLTPVKIDRLVAKLDHLRAEPHVEFSTMESAISYLRSISKHR